MIKEEYQNVENGMKNIKNFDWILVILSNDNVTIKVNTKKGLEKKKAIEEKDNLLLDFPNVSIISKTEIEDFYGKFSYLFFIWYVPKNPN